MPSLYTPEGRRIATRPLQFSFFRRTLYPVMQKAREDHILLTPLHLLRRHWRRRRLLLFLRMMRPAAGATILDLGGGRGDFFYNCKNLIASRGLAVTVADIDSEALKTARRRGFDTLQVEADGLASLRDKSFDIVFSNSVIEHVTLPKEEVWRETDDRLFTARARAHQKRFAVDIRRIGKGYFVQTPHPAFPLESHTWLPFAARLPRKKLVRLCRNLARWWIKPTTPDFMLLNELSMRAMFPDATVIVKRTLALPKELIAFKPVSSGP